MSEPTVAESMTYSVSEDSLIQTYHTRKETIGLRVDNFSYTKNVERDGLVFWRCSNRKCSARAVTTLELTQCEHKSKFHNHPPKTEEYFESLMIKQGIKRRISLDTTERPQKAVDMAIKDVNEDSLSAKDLKQFTGVAKRKKTV